MRDEDRFSKRYQIIRIDFGNKEVEGGWYEEDGVED